MNDWTNWFLLAGILTIGELLTGTFYLLMLALGCIAGAVFALLKFHLAWQLIIGAVIGTASIFILRRSKLIKRHYLNSASARNPDINLDIGQTLYINAWQHQDGKYIARVKYRGAMWDVELLANDIAQIGNYAIREVRGNRLLVTYHSVK